MVEPKILLVDEEGVHHVPKRPLEELLL